MWFCSIAYALKNCGAPALCSHCLVLGVGSWPCWAYSLLEETEEVKLPHKLEITTVAGAAKSN